MTWSKPTLHEINLDAEIGSYQDDFSDEPRIPIVERSEDDQDDETA
jgi:hypothetical protein